MRFLYCWFYLTSFFSFEPFPPRSRLSRNIYLEEMRSKMPATRKVVGLAHGFTGTKKKVEWIIVVRNQKRENTGGLWEGKQIQCTLWHQCHLLIFKSTYRHGRRQPFRSGKHQGKFKCMENLKSMKHLLYLLKIPSQDSKSKTQVKIPSWKPKSRSQAKISNQKHKS